MQSASRRTATLWWEGQAYDLNDLIANNSAIGDTLFLHVATGINSAGQIVGTFGGFSSEEPLSIGRIYMLTPIAKPCDGDVDDDGNVGFSDLTQVLLAWGSCEGAPCPADVTHDGEVGFADLTYILIHWGLCPG
jgi:hypothetical protein